MQGWLEVVKPCKFQPWRNKVVSTLIWRCSTVCRPVNLATTLKKRWNVCRVTVPPFSSWLFTISQLKVPFRCHSEITQPVNNSSWHGFFSLENKSFLHQCFNAVNSKNHTKVTNHTKFHSSCVKNFSDSAKDLF